MFFLFCLLLLTRRSFCDASSSSLLFPDRTHPQHYVWENGENLTVVADNFTHVLFRWCLEDTRCDSSYRLHDVNNAMPLFSLLTDSLVKSTLSQVPSWMSPHFAALATLVGPDGLHRADAADDLGAVQPLARRSWIMALRTHIGDTSFNGAAICDLNTVPTFYQDTMTVACQCAPGEPECDEIVQTWPFIYVIFALVGLNATLITVALIVQMVLAQRNFMKVMESVKSGTQTAFLKPQFSPSTVIHLLNTMKDSL